ncbi:SIR2-domain-containing protein [Sparassis latifolia]
MPSSSPGLHSNRRRLSSIYALQVQAFLDAAEVVDADMETIEDILDGYREDAPAEQAGAADATDVGLGYLDGDEPDLDVELEDMTDFDVQLREAQTAWTKEQTKEMMTWLKEFGMGSFINKYVVTNAIPIPKLLYAFGICLCKELREKRTKTLLFFLRVALSRELQSREKLTAYNTIDDAVTLIRRSKRILVLTGAGISVSCGIPDFRSRNGLYAALQEKGEYDLDDPQQMFDITYFRENPSGMFALCKIYPSNFIPSPCHRFIKLIEDKGKLLRNYTQNIDTLERQAGVQHVLQCHGSFAIASCLNCHVRVPGSEIEDDILNHRVPLCKICNAAPSRPASNNERKKKSKRRRASRWNSDESDGSEEPDVPEFPPGIMKPDITFFGEKLSDVFDRSLLEDRQKLDLLIVIGTSLKVSPVSEILAHLPHSVPQILINKTPIKHINPDIVLLGNADDVVQHLCRKLGWDLPDPRPHTNGGSLGTATRGNPRKRLSESPEPQRVADTHVWLFEGAEGGKWVEELERKAEKSLPNTDSRESTPSERNLRRQLKKTRVQ